MKSNASRQSGPRFFCSNIDRTVNDENPIGYELASRLRASSTAVF
jgi:hypothetical protein